MMRLLATLGLLTYAGVGLSTSFADNSAPHSSTEVVEQPHLLLRWCWQCHSLEVQDKERGKTYFRGGFLLPARATNRELWEGIKVVLDNHGLNDRNKVWSSTNADVERDLRHALKILDKYGQEPFRTGKIDR